MKVSIEIVLAFFIILFVCLGIYEFLQNDKKFNTKIKTRIKISAIFFIIIIFNLLITKN